MRLEPLILAVILYAYWFPSPQRDAVIGLIAIYLPVLVARYIQHRRLWTNTPFDEWCVAFIALCLINIEIAPYTPRGIVIFRPLLGMALLLSCVEFARARGRLSPLLMAGLAGALLVGFLSVTAVNWQGKATLSPELNQFLPNLQEVPPLWVGGFNPNEIGGVIALLLPFAAGVLLRLPGGDGRGWLRVLAAAAVALLLAGLALGQSLSALAGCAVGLVVVAMPRGGWRWAALAGVIGLLTFQIAIAAAPSRVIDLAKALSPRRDTNSLNHREVIWQSAVAMLRDHPLTGTGISNFRFLQYDYPTPGYEGVLTPHAHNALLQIGADLGWPGVIVYIGWYGVAGYVLLKAWRRGGPVARAAAVALAGGLLSFAIYGLADAIPLWDRFAFVLWWMLGLTAATALMADAEAANQAEAQPPAMADSSR